MIELQKSYWVEGPIESDQAADLIAKVGEFDQIGGIDIFLGQIRADAVNGSEVTGIEYSAHKPMAEAAFDQVKQNAFQSFSDVQSVVILHSLGLVEVGGLSLLVLVAAGHRDAAFKCCRQVVEEIKAQVPIWKKEYLQEGHSWVGDPDRT